MFLPLFWLSKRTSIVSCLTPRCVSRYMVHEFIWYFAHLLQQIINLTSKLTFLMIHWSDSSKLLCIEWAWISLKISLIVLCRTLGIWQWMYKLGTFLIFTEIFERELNFKHFVVIMVWRVRKRDTSYSIIY